MNAFTLPVHHYDGPGILGGADVGRQVGGRARHSQSHTIGILLVCDQMKKKMKSGKKGGKWQRKKEKKREKKRKKGKSVFLFLFLFLFFFPFSSSSFFFVFLPAICPDEAPNSVCLKRPKECPTAHDRCPEWVVVVRQEKEEETYQKVIKLCNQFLIPLHSNRMEIYTI